MSKINVEHVHSRSLSRPAMSMLLQQRCPKSESHGDARPIQGKHHVRAILLLTFLLEAERKGTVRYHCFGLALDLVRRFYPRASILWR